MPDSNRVGMKRSSCYLPSIYGDSQGGSSSSDKDACIAKTSEKQDLGKDYYFNNLTPLFLKSSFQRNAVLAQEKEIKAHDQSLVIDSSKESHGLSERFEGQKPLISDNHSEAVSCHRRGFGIKRKSDNSWCDDEVTLMESSSVCSLEASNNTDDSSYSSDDNDEEPEKEKPSWVGTRVKTRRNPETHSFNKRKRRDMINKKMRILKELIPNCNKMDKASMLDDAIEYLKTLKLQLQIMSMGAGLCMPHMMLPHQMINTPHLPQLMGFSFRPGSTNIPFTVPQFPVTPLSGIIDNRVGMFGFPNQVPTMPFSHAPFIPMFGIENPCTQPHLPISTASNMVENLASSQLTTQKASVTNNSYLNGRAQCEAKQALNHVSFHH